MTVASAATWSERGATGLAGLLAASLAALVTAPLAALPAEAGATAPAVPGLSTVAGAAAPALPAASPAVPAPAAALADTGRVLGAEAAPEIAVYVDGSALVRESRRMELTAGEGWLRWDDPPATLDPTSVLLDLPADEARVLEGRFSPAAADLGAILPGLVGREISLTLSEGEVVRGVLRSHARDLVLEGRGGGISVLPRGEAKLFRFHELPEGYRPSPEHLWRVDARRAGQATGWITYLASGISWRAEHVVRLAPDETRLDLEGWAQLSNDTDRTWEDARVKLVAGEVARAPDRRDVRVRAEALALAEAPDRPGVEPEERDFFEYRLFELPRPLTLTPGEERRIRLLSAADVPVVKRFIAAGGETRVRAARSPDLRDEAGAGPERIHPAVRLEFATGDEVGVGQDLPRGRVRIYREDVDGTPLLAGEDRIADIPAGDSVRLHAGRAFRITVERSRTDFSRPDRRTLEEEFRLTLRNAREEPAEVRAVETLFRWHDWELLEAEVDGRSVEPERLDAHRVFWDVPVEAGGTTVLTYRVRYLLP